MDRTPTSIFDLPTDIWSLFLNRLPQPLDIKNVGPLLLVSTGFTKTLSACHGLSFHAAFKLGAFPDEYVPTRSVPEQLAMICDHFPRLQKLRVQGGDTFLSEDLTPLKKLQWIKDLDLSYCDKLTNKIVEFFNSPDLTRLVISGCPHLSGTGFKPCTAKLN